MRRAWVLCVMVGGCDFLAEPLPTNQPIVDTGDLPTPTPPPPTRPAVPCNTDVGEIGVAGGHAVNSVSFTWSQDVQVAFAPPIRVRLPEDTISVSLTGMANGGILSIGRVELNGEDITSGINQDPFVSALVQGSLPTNFETDLTFDVPQGGSCLRVDLFASEDQVGQPGQLNILSRRGGIENVVDLNLIFAGGTEALISQEDGAAMVARISETWSGVPNGPIVGETTVYTLNANGLVTRNEASQYTGSEVEPDDPTGVDVFFFRDLTDGEQGVLGFSGGIPGVLGFDGFPNSGVVILMDAHANFNGTITGEALGSTIAHEVGHQLGLHHATERDGSSTAFYSDVPRCGPNNDDNGDGLVDAFECQFLGADNFMFWQGGDQDYEISPEQAFVLAQSAITK